MVTVGSILRGVGRFVRANLGPIAIWMALYLVFTILMRLGLAPFYAARLAAVDAAARGLAIAPPPIGTFLLILALMLALMLVLYNAVFRAVLFPADRAAAYLRVGMDEVRLFGLAVVLVVAFFGAMLLGGFLIGMVGTVMIRLLGGTVQSASLFVSICLLGFWLVMIGCGIRLSVAAPLTLYRRKIAIGAGWTLGGERFWTLLGANLVLLLGAIVLMLIAMIPTMGAMMAAMTQPGDTDAARKLAELQVDQMRLTLTPLGILWLVASSVIGGAIVTIFGALPAVATVQLLDRKGARP